MCNCLPWARTPEMTNHGGKYPSANHHPHCEDYKLQDYVRVTYDGSSCIMEPSEAQAVVDSDSEYTTEVVQLTEDQFQALPEFSGF